MSSSKDMRQPGRNRETEAEIKTLLALFDARWPSIKSAEIGPDVVLSLDSPNRPYFFHIGQRLIAGLRYRLEREIPALVLAQEYGAACDAVNEVCGALKYMYLSANAIDAIRGVKRAKAA